MSTSWTAISAREAAQHRLFGIKGWLLVFALGHILVLLRAVAEVGSEAHKAGMTLTALLAIDHPTVSFIKASLAIEVASLLLVYWALLTRAKNFRAIASATLLSKWPLYALAGMFFQVDGVGESIGLTLLPWAVGCAIWVSYLQRSERVRVTFEQKVKASGKSIPSQSAPGSEFSLPTPSGLKPTPVRDARLGTNRMPTRTPYSPPQPQSEDVPVPQVLAQRSSVGNLHESKTLLSSGGLLEVDDERLWAHSLEEFEGPNRRSGLWAKCFAEANGIESVAKAAYLSARAAQLKNEFQKFEIQQQLADAEERRRASASEAQRLLDIRKQIEKNSPELISLLAFIRANNEVPGEILARATHLMGGTIQRSPTQLFRPRTWHAAFKGSMSEVTDLVEARQWFIDTVFPEVEAGILQILDHVLIGKCPSCHAFIELSSVHCAKCDAQFGPESAWKPQPLP